MNKFSTFESYFGDSPNILLDETLSPYISDFGVAKAVLESFLTAKHTVVGTPFWMAPEVMKAEPYTFSADVYGFAIILYEMACNQLPFQGLNPTQVIGKVAYANERPSLPNNIDRTFKDIIERVWTISSISFFLFE